VKTKYVTVLLIAFILGFTTVAYSQNHHNERQNERQGVHQIDQRIRDAHERIDRGINSGALTREEAHRLRGELNRVRDDEARMKADGRLTHREAEQLEKELHRLEKHISQLKHNDRRR